MEGLMRVLAIAGLMLALSGCATSGYVVAEANPAQVEAPVIAQPSARAPRRSQQELLAAYWAERRAPRPLLVSDFVADFSARRPTIQQNFPESEDSEDQWLLDAERLDRESAATRAAVQAALGR
jgi:hypothetical protein